MNFSHRYHVIADVEGGLNIRHVMGVGYVGCDGYRKGHYWNNFRSA